MAQSSSWLRQLRIGAQLLMTLSLLLTLAAPVLQSAVTPGPASAAAAGTDPEPSIEPDLVELPPEGEDPPIDEPPIEQPSDVQPPDEEPSITPDPLAGTLTIFLWECPGGYDPTDPASDPASDCTTPLENVPFALDQDDSFGDLSQVTGEFGISGAVSFGFVGPGPLTVTQTLPSGIVAAFDIGCSTNDTGVRDVTGASFDTVAIDFSEGSDVTCSWFDIPEGVGTDSTGNTITIEKWLCPAGYDYLDPDSSPEDDCTEPLDGIEFELARTSPSTTALTATTGDDSPGVATFTGFEPGMYDLTEIASPYAENGFRVCNDFGFGNPGAEPTTVGEPFSFEVEAGQTFDGFCDWYNIDTPVNSGSPSASGSASADPDTNTITIEKWLCPYGYDYLDPDSSPEDDCTQRLDGIEFELARVSPSPSATTATTGSSGPGVAIFTGFEPGMYELTEVASPYEADGFRVCNDFGFGNPGAEPTTVGEPFAFEVEDGQLFDGVCDWYNVDSEVGADEPGVNRVTIHKWLCPAGYDYDPLNSNPTADCTERVDGVGFALSEAGSTTPTMTGTTGDDGFGTLVFEGFDPGSYLIAETDPGYTPASYFSGCSLGGEQSALMDPEAPATAFLDQDPYDFPEGQFTQLVCNWYNIPYDNSITIYKWSCPYGYDFTAPNADPYLDCTAVKNAVDFTVDNLETSFTDATGNDGPGTAVFEGLTPATWTITETLPFGYDGVLIGECYQRDDLPTGAFTSGDGVLSTEVDIPVDGSTHWVCHWFNLFSDDPGQVIIYKWTCPAGYDIYAYGANAAVDCTEVTNGVQFNATGPDGYASQTDTGDSIDGAVMFGGLEPGDYTFTETIPEDIGYVFVADCTGTSVDAVHPYPLSIGNPLLVRVNPGDEIVCNWYNVPDLDEGTIVLTKYICSTPTYTAEVNCEIYEGGATFTLLYRDGPDPVEVSDGTTGPNGKLTWIELPEGGYTVKEEDGTPCRITASQIEGGYIAVTDGQTTYVSVYNCTSTASPSASGSRPPAKPSNAPPGKFPNTGTDPNAAVGPVVLPVAGTETESPEPESPSTDEESSTEPDASATTEDASACLVLSAPNVEASPSESPSGSSSPSPSPSEQVVEEASLAPEPEDAEETCERGAVPARITVEAGDIAADIEIIETVDGQMQAPTGAEDASWYRETSRLGEEGPIVIAGHLNYWNTPEGVFYALAELEAGDLIEVTGDDGSVFQYEVQSTTQFLSDASPNDLFESVDESAGGETMVLITCGGEWDTSISEYNERTVVVAVRVPAEDEAA